MKKIILLIISVLILTGCVNNEIDGEDSPLKTYCDKEYGIEYIRDKGYNHGGITVRLDSNGQVIHCK